MAAMAAALSVEVEGWDRELDALMARVGGCFARVETRRTARDVIDGLLADLPRKNCWSLAEYAAHASPDRVQHLLSRASWDDAGVRAELAVYAAENLACGVDPDLVTLIFDETGDAKKGRHTVGVQRQYSGTCGRIENCQVAVFATLATPAGHAFVDVELYLPRSWACDADRLAAAGAPAGVEFATKPQLALRMTDRVLAGAE
jgi:SRSO17 transposase